MLKGGEDLSLYLDFDSVCLLIITIVIVVVGVFIIKVLKKMAETIVNVNKIIEKSEYELEGTIKNVEKVTREAGQISEHVTSLTSKADAAGKVAANVVSKLIKKL